MKNGKPYRLTWYQKVYDLIRFGPMAVRQYLRDRKEKMSEFMDADQ